MLNAPPGREARNDPRSGTHVIVCGNEKGGSGKSTIAVHIAVALLKSGRRVATVDLDSRQSTMTRYLDNRQRWSQAAGTALACPEHLHVPASGHDQVSEAEQAEFAALAEALTSVEGRFDFVVVDTPGSDTYLNRLAHRMADTLVTPVNDSFIDIDVLARVDPDTGAIAGVSQYAQSVLDARLERRATNNAVTDWVVLRNRLATISSRNERKVDASLRQLSRRLGFRVADGVSERTVFREFFPIGLTALDDFEDQVPGGKATMSHLGARREMRSLVAALRLPLEETAGQCRPAERGFLSDSSGPVERPGIFAS